MQKHPNYDQPRLFSLCLQGARGARGAGGRSLVAGLAVAMPSTQALRQHGGRDQDAAEQLEDDVLRDVDRLMDWARADEASETLD